MELKLLLYIWLSLVGGRHLRTKEYLRSRQGKELRNE